MISIGYSTRETNPNFKKHLIDTIGVKDVEIIEIINHGDKSLSECYEILINNAKYDKIVICHDDISLSKSPKWGRKLIKNFNDNPEFNILGVAGTTRFNDSAIWWENTKHLVGQVDHTDGKKTWTSFFSSNLDDNIAEVVVLDGVFICVDRLKLKYSPDKNIDGFHFYDIDFTFGNHINGGKNGVMTNIKILHKSIGQTSDQWEVNRLKFINKWGDKIKKEIKPSIFIGPRINNIKNQPKLGIVILNKSNNYLLFDCLKSILNSDYNNYKIYIGDTGSSEREIDEIKSFISQYKNIKLIKIGEYKFSKNNNQIVNDYLDKDTDLILFCNNDIMFLSDVIPQMVDTYLKNKNNIGTIGCRLHYEDNTIQHAGIGLYKRKQDGAVLGISHIGINSSYNYGNKVNQVIGNTAALMMVSTKLFKNIGGFNEAYNECFEDVEFNIKCILLNKKNYILTNCVAYHYESKTRILNEDKENKTKEDYNSLLIPFIKKNYDKISNLIIEI